MKLFLYLGLSALLLLQTVRANDVDKVCCDTETGCFTNEPPYGHLPLPRCPLNLAPTFRLYTTQNPTNEQYITRDSIPGVFSPVRRTIFLVHGYLGSGTTTWLKESRRLLLERGDFNVIQVGWFSGANEIWYPQSAANTRAVASEIVLITERLRMFTGINKDLFWCVGHSLGAHTCGIAGMKTDFGRVTGLDPAGPEWASYDMMAGINPTSAPFVDVIHTDGKSLLMAYGQMRPLGHYDFYPNGGHGQPGCVTYAGREVDFASRDQQDSILSCSHSRAPAYWVESIEMDCYISRDVCTNHNNIPGSCSPCAGDRPCTYMGFAADSSPGGPGLYYLKTGNGWFWSDFCEW